jgi:hypothetical protein
MLRMGGMTLAAVAALSTTGLCAEAAKTKTSNPRITAIHPVAGGRGESFTAVIHGGDLAGARAALFTGGGLQATVTAPVSKDGTEVQLRVSVDGDAQTGLHDLRVVTARGITNKISFDVLAAPVIEETAVKRPLTQFPVTICGRLAQPGETDAYWIEISGGATLTFEAISHVAGFDPAVVLYEPSGSWFDARRLNRIAFNDEPLYFPGLSTNARLVHHFPRGGRYCVKVSGFNGEGGPDRAYELRITPGETAAPDLHPEGKAVFAEREFTRIFGPNRLQDLARRGGTTDKEQIVEGFHAVPEGSPEIPAATLPGIVEGCIARPGAADVIRLQIDKAQDIAFEVETPQATLPRFNPVIRLMEPGGREIATDVYTKLNNNGLYMMKMIRAKTTLSIGAPGEYTMQIRDITTGGAGADFRYRILVRPQIPHVGNVEIAPDHVNLAVGGSQPVTVAIDREEGFRGFVTVDVEGLPQGITALTALENPEDKPPLPNGGRLERYTPREQRTTVMLIAALDAPVSELPALIRVIVRVIGEGRPATPLAVKEIPLMVLPSKTS